ncbi:MAG: hypothetical protein WA814_13875, partial [Candidatus Baltobacteraceae bacterium]
MRVTRFVSSLLVGVTLAACSHSAGPSLLPSTLTPSFMAGPSAGGFKSLYSFKGLPDGMEPAGGMVVLDGKLYGTTQVGGKADSGAVFTTDAAGNEHVLYSFGSAG